MRCINKLVKVISCIMVPTIVLSGCGTKVYSFEYDRTRNNSNYSIAAQSQGQALDAFSADLCVTTDDVTQGTTVDMSQATAAGLFDINNGNVIYAKNVHEKLNPASLTKVLTALCALKYGNLDDVLTASENVYVHESGAVKLGLEAGDTMTLDQALHALMLKSANDVAIMIAEYLGGSVEGFADMMNEVANSLGATNSHFVNPNGLTDPNHYTTAYDLYLIFQAAMKYDDFMEILQTPEYEASYQAADGTAVSAVWKSTNQFTAGNTAVPEGVSAVGGKTGTTTAARSCLVQLFTDAQGQRYVAIILGCKERAILYEEMLSFLSNLNN